jgi:hypothetical protein
MSRCEMFCKIVGQVCVAGSPVDVELFLCHSILDPVVAHVHRFGPLLF